VRLWCWDGPTHLWKICSRRRTGLSSCSIGLLYFGCPVGCGSVALLAFCYARTRNGGQSILLLQTSHDTRGFGSGVVDGSRTARCHSFSVAGSCCCCGSAQFIPNRRREYVTALCSSNTLLKIAYQVRFDLCNPSQTRTPTVSLRDFSSDGTRDVIAWHFGGSTYLGHSNQAVKFDVRVST
jgi:hypothetical protein